MNYWLFGDIKIIYNIPYKFHGGSVYIIHLNHLKDEAFSIILSPGCHKIAEKIYALTPFSIPRYKENLRQATGKS